jgi:hypothetical protein
MAAAMASKEVMVVMFFTTSNSLTSWGGCNPWDLKPIYNGKSQYIMDNPNSPIYNGKSQFK